MEQEKEEPKQPPTLTVGIGTENGLVALIFEAAGGCIYQKILVPKELAENMINGIKATINKMESRIITQ